MLFRKVILTTTFLLTLNFCFAQDSKPTYEQTVNWITTKLSSYFIGMNGEYSDWCTIKKFENGVTFSITDCKLIMQGRANWCDPSNVGSLCEKYDVTVSIPIYDIDVATSFGPYYETQIACKTNSVKVEIGEVLIKYSAEDEYVHYRNAHTDFYGSRQLAIDWAREENLKVRMRQALINLQSYCPKPKSNEPF
jgi:hypothetical protein